MGVPGFFMWLLKQYNDSGFVFSGKIDNIDWLLFDTNCLVHPVCQKVLEANPKYGLAGGPSQDELEELMINAVLEYIEELTKYANPKEGIFVAIDGSAPMAKIKQQRLRRFKSIADKKLFDTIKKKHSREIKPWWNSNAITPATDFMVKLDISIKKWAVKQKTKVIYSSCFSAGEGEHKLLDFIRTNIKLKYKYVVYGLDADLLFLSMSSQASDIYLLRETQEMDKQVLPIENSKLPKLSYVNIDHMKLLIRETITNLFFENGIDKPLIKSIETKNLINDFIFLCYFLGNDFLPHLPTLDIHHNGIDYLLKAYSKVFTNYYLENHDFSFMIDVSTTPKINYDLLKTWLTTLSLEEDTILLNNYHNKRIPKTFSSDPYDKEMFKIDNILFRFADPIQLGSDSSELWKTRYYKHYWQNANIQNICNEYFKGIEWTTQYYFSKCVDWTWFYPYNNPPFISDMAKYLVKQDINWNVSNAMPPLLQLLLVLPPQSSYLVPKPFQRLMLDVKSPIIKYYPTEFQQDYIGKRKYWQSIPLLPPINIKAIYDEYKKIYEGKDLNEFEKNKNKPQPIHLFGF